MRRLKRKWEVWRKELRSLGLRLVPIRIMSSLARLKSGIMELFLALMGFVL